MGLAAIALFFSQTFSRTSRFEFVQPSSHTLGTVLQQNYEHKRNRVAAALESGELEASTARTGTIVHEVKSGESLWQLAKQYKMEAAAIAASNQIAPDTQLKTGQKLYLPRAEGLLYTVQPGDTLEGIAADFGVNRAAIIRTTPLKNAGYLRVGQKLVLPGKVDDLLVTRQQLLADRASWTAQPQVGVIGLPSAAPVASVQTYTVNPGDTLEAIANRFGITQTQLLSANPGLNPDFLSVGQSLTIPTKVASGVGTPTAAAVQTYTVTAGDTLGEIASRFGVSQQSLIAANPGVIPSQIEVGQQLTVPPADSASAAISLSGSVATPATLLASGFVMPTSGTFTSGFGWRWGRMHNGIDIAGPVGTPVHAAQSGTVVYAGYHLGGYGYLVKILHPNGLMTLYAHGYGIYVSQGQTVSQGQVIMSRGNTGWSTGPHLHFEVHINDVPVDPSPYLR
jgi:murein DD-endopeptidase MepM/ murein hydrolase activator NlpD